MKIKSRDVYSFRDLIRLLNSYKSGEISYENVCQQIESLLCPYSDLLEEILLYFNQKKVIKNNNFRSTQLTKNH
jgi:hypothetical protein